MQHKIRDCGRRPSLTVDVGNVFLMKSAQPHMLLMDIYVAPDKHFFLSEIIS